MEQRISDRLGTNLDVSTFHALGLQIIAEVEGVKPSVSELSTDSQKLCQQLEAFLKNRVGLNASTSFNKMTVGQQQLVNQNHFLELLNHYFIYHLRPYRSVFEFSSHGEYIEYIKEHQIRSLKGDLVKSYEECEIANFLYINGVEYRYEEDYERRTASRDFQQYQPDFFLPDYGIYIEHFGIDRQGNTAPFINQRRYTAEMAWKRGLHKQHQTTLLETYSYEKTEGTLLSHLEAALKQHRVQFQRIPQEELFTRINALGVVTPFIELLAKFLNLFKSQPLTLDEIRTKAKGYSDWQRYFAFLDIFIPIFHDYTSYLQSVGKIDFNDMINRATQYVVNNSFNRSYQYILVDEFQDISQSRYRLLKALVDQNPSCKLFGVGDDWQSIYRFTGSDLTIMTQFPQYFGITEQMYLDRTFRFNDKICAFSSQFITKNPDQISKRLTTQDAISEPGITLVWSTSMTNDILHCLTEIQLREPAEASVFIIGRYRHHRPRQLQLIRRKFPALSITYNTAHSLKGREADYILLINLNSGRYGFPCQIQDDPVLNLVLAKPDAYPNAEERRLFYVAVTHAKKHVYLLAHLEHPSSFATEITRDQYDVKLLNNPADLLLVCPQCKTGRIVKKDGNWGTFFSCNNYPYCDYKPTSCPSCHNGVLFLDQQYYRCINNECKFHALICPRCHNGYLRRRTGRRGAFLGCSNYPQCYYTQNI